MFERFVHDIVWVLSIIFLKNSLHIKYPGLFSALIEKIMFLQISNKVRGCIVEKWHISHFKMSHLTEK